jgi:hypothetical protein
MAPLCISENLFTVMLYYEDLSLSVEESEIINKISDWSLEISTD